ncbi:uncharacterized protein [Gossypium hirsutum]|uniref:Endonuclease/exonuclease/phosphatase domain-containing protein n=1 Tax=Gossypium hirsutum TaxID=3635 RepID=A0A1U8HML8_GOSHI|nr:uncharacterized protein LOC107887534 [Gossypium hirsutum]
MDYDLALTQGPWIVFGHYLTVQPWTVEFDPLKPFPSVVTARIRFPGLPGFLYKKRILEKIGSLVGKVMKLDFKTDSGVRGQIARMAVSIDLKQPLTSQVSINGRIQRVEFEALPTEDAPVTVDKDTTPVTAVEAFGPWMVVQRKSRRNQAGKLNHQAKVAEGNPDGSRFKALFTEKNQLADFGAKKSGVDNSGAEILGLKEIAFKQGNFSRKLKDNRPGGNYGHRAEGNKGKEIVDHNRFIGLKDKASGLVHLEVEQEKAGQGQTHGDLILENKTGFNPDGSQPISTGPMESKGCASSKFIRVFHEYNREHKPDLISLIETRVSGEKVDSIIAKLGISDTSSRQPLFVTFVYASPNHSKWRSLWETLQRTIPVDGSPWMAIGDFNAILSPSEKRGGRTLGKRCPFFGEFMDSALLQYLGFRGPHFTWLRGGIMERLDRAICNNAWCTLFPNSLVTHLPRLKSDHRPLKLSLMPALHSSQGRPFRFLAGWVEYLAFSDFVKEN